jgi:hypothetical protein
MTCFVQNNVVSLIVQKKNGKKEEAQNGVVVNDTICLLLPLDALQAREEEDCSPTSPAPISLSLFVPKT